MHRLKLIVVALATFLSNVALAGTPTKGADQYFFEKKEFERQTVEVTFVIFKNRGELIKYTRANGIYMPNDVASVSTISKANNKCTIYTIDPSSKYIPEQYGHELMHCLYGRWHEVGL